MRLTSSSHGLYLSDTRGFSMGEDNERSLPSTIMRFKALHRAGYQRGFVG